MNKKISNNKNTKKIKREWKENMFKQIENES